MSLYPRPKTRTYLKGEQTREQIIHTAKKLFTQRGYHQTSIYDLFDDAGITKGAFYHHWKTKEELALTVLKGMRRAYEKRIFSMLNSEAPAIEIINDTLGTLAKLNSKPDWVYCRLMATWSTELDSKEDALGAAVHEMRKQWLEFWKELLKRAQDQGDLRKDISATDLSFLVVSTISGVYLMTKRQGCGNQKSALNTLNKILMVD